MSTVLYHDGSHYHGQVVREIKHGNGKLTSPAPQESKLDQTTDVNVVYEGLFENGKREGNGHLFIENGSFSLESLFKEDQPEYEAN